MLKPNFSPIQKQFLMLLMGISLSTFPISATLAADDKPPPSGRSSGSRGCGLTTAPTTTEAPSLILLAPNQQRGQTTLARPTFAWFVRDAEPRPLEFRLYEVEKSQFKLIKHIKGDGLKSNAGIMMISLSDADPALTVGKRYRWQIEMVCNPSRPSSNLFAEAELDVVAMPATLKKTLEQSQAPSTQVKLLADAKLWYDAVYIAFPTTQAANALKDAQRSLLFRIAITDIERQLLSNSPTHILK